MKPTKNSIYCPECHRTKMLFESEAKAKNFMRFNSEKIEELNGKAPVRAYFCDACGGWHLTSSEVAYSYSPTKRKLDCINQFELDYKDSRTKILLRQRIEGYSRIVPLASDGLYNEAFDAFRKVMVSIPEYEKLCNTRLSKFDKLKSEGPEIADMLLTKMYDELIVLMQDAEMSSKVLNKKITTYRKAIETLPMLGKKYKLLYQKHSELIQNTHN